MPRVLIAGCGYVGSATAELFHAARLGSGRLDGVGRISGAIGGDAAIASARSIFQIASRRSQLLQRRSTRSFNARVRAVETPMTTGASTSRRAKNLSAAFPDARLVFTSSTSVYAQTDGEWVTEQSRCRIRRARPVAILRETEEFVLGRGGIVARLAGIYGPGRSALLRKFLDGTAVLDPSPTASSTRLIAMTSRRRCCSCRTADRMTTAAKENRDLQCLR